MPKINTNFDNGTPAIALTFKFRGEVKQISENKIHVLMPTGKEGIHATIIDDNHLLGAIEYDKITNKINEQILRSIAIIE